MDQELMFLQLLDEAQEYRIVSDGAKLEILAERTVNDKLEDVIILAFHAK